MSIHFGQLRDEFRANSWPRKKSSIASSLDDLIGEEQRHLIASSHDMKRLTETVRDTCRPFVPVANDVTILMHQQTRIASHRRIRGRRVDWWSQGEEGGDTVCGRETCMMFAACTLLVSANVYTWVYPLGCYMAVS